jgi:hypothetical protein
LPVERPACQHLRMTNHCKEYDVDLWMITHCEKHHLGFNWGIFASGSGGRRGRGTIWTPRRACKPDPRVAEDGARRGWLTVRPWLAGAPNGAMADDWCLGKPYEKIDDLMLERVFPKFWSIIQIARLSLVGRTDDAPAITARNRPLAVAHPTLHRRHPARTIRGRCDGSMSSAGWLATNVCVDDRIGAISQRPNTCQPRLVCTTH